VRALVLALVAVLVATGCSHVPAVATSDAGARTGNPWTHHGLLRIANLSEPDTLNPVVGNQQIDFDLAFLWGGYLFNFSDRDEFIPELATAMPTLANGGISRDGKTLVYHLRRGVMWQDGKPFDADDVIFTWHAIMNKKNNVGSTVGYDDILSIEKRDAYTIAVHLKAVYAPFTATFFAPSGNPYPVLPAHLLAAYSDINRVTYNSQPIGTGPFIVRRWARGSKIVLRANPHYWRGPPKLKEIWYTPVPDENTIVTQLQSHEVDLEYNGSQRNYAQFTHLAGFRTVLTPFTGYGELAVNVSAPNLTDVRVRRALWYALDTKRIITDVSHGVDTNATSDQPTFSWAYTADVTRYPYDPARARALLDAAGWKIGADGIRSKGGRRLSLVIASSSGSATANAIDVLVERYFHDVGIDAIVKNYPTSLFFASAGAGGIVQNSKFDIAFYSWLNGTDPDDSVLFMCDQFPPIGQNVYRFCNAELDAAEHVAIDQNDRSKRRNAYGTIQRVLARDVPMIPLYFARRISVQNSDLKNYRVAKAVTSFWNPYEWEI
jgi:peptide/nickel transport system substrate-binding protein